MIEPIMFFGIGFLVAALLTIGVIPLVHNRAVRLTVKRLEASIPVSMAEIQADKDQLRAEFAMSTRRLEMSVEQMKAKTTSQLAEIGKKADAINRLKGELSEKTAAIVAIESREKALREQMRATEDEFTTKTAALREAERALAEKKGELDKLSMELTDRSFAVDSQRVEVVALRAQVEALKGRVDHFDREAREVEGRLDRERRETTAAAQQLADERSRAEQLASRAEELERQLAAQNAEAELLSKSIRELEARLGEQGRLLAERDYQIERLRADLAAAGKVESELRAALYDVDNRQFAATESIRQDRAKAEEQVRQLADERARLLEEIAAMKHNAESTWAAERVENALLRERINDVAAEVARLTVVLEGPNSPIGTILADDAGHSPSTAPVNGDTGEQAAAPAPAHDPAPGTLADRIRALQSRASRIPTATN